MPAHRIHAGLSAKALASFFAAFQAWQRHQRTSKFMARIFRKKMLAEAMSGYDERLVEWMIASRWLKIVDQWIVNVEISRAAPASVSFAWYHP